MAQVNQLGGSQPPNPADKPQEKPAEKKPRQGSQHIPKCPACVDAKGKPLQCIPKTFPLETRYYCPNYSKCPMHFSVDVPRPLREIEEEQKTVDDPIGHSLRPLGDAVS